jgi:hypothetical protein
MNITYTLAEFIAAMAKLRAAENVTVLPGSDDKTGAVNTQYVNFTYTYDGTTLAVMITRKNGFAKLKSDDYIYGKIQAMLESV